MTRVVVTGSAGMLGRAIVDAAPDGVQVLGVTRAEGDLATTRGVERAVVEQTPEMVIHAAAYTDVDGCERNPPRAWRDNALATRLVAEACWRIGARLVHISTDYVFDGLARRPYTEEDRTGPVNVYGETKLAAERAVAEVPRALILRTQWLFGPGGRNFVAAILRRARQGQELSVVADQTGCPTYTLHLAEALWRAALSERGGVVHLAGQGTATWLDVAQAALEAAGMPRAIKPLRSEDWPSPTRRPRYTVLEQARWHDWFGEPLPSWWQGVREYVRRLVKGDE